MPTYTRHAVVGYFNDDRTAQKAVEELVVNGFSRDQVHVSSSTDYATEAATGGAGLTGRAPSEKQGGIAGWFRSLFESDEYDQDADRYSEHARAGGSVVAVDASDEMHERAIAILNSNGASDIDKGDTPTDGTVMPGVASTVKGTAPAARSAVSSTGNLGENRTIPVIREDLEIGKRAVQSGGVRVYSKTVEKPVEEQVRLRQERVVVDRQATDRPVTAADEKALRDQTIEVLEMSEEPVVQKRARVVEEVRVGKEASERTETVRDTVRHTEVKTEPITGGTSTRATPGVMGNYSSDFQRDFESRYGVTGGDYKTYSPAYEYGATMAGDPRYQGKNWSDVESNLRTDFGRQYPESTWERMKDAVQYGWDKVTAKR